MTALAKQRVRHQETWKYKQFTLPSGKIAYPGGIAAGQTSGGSAGKVIPGETSTTIFVVGLFAEKVDATSAAKLVTVDLQREVEIEWFANGTGGDEVTASDVFGLCYVKDDQTVSVSSTGKSVAGRVWAVDSSLGVAVEKLGSSNIVGATGEIDADQVSPGNAYEVFRTNSGATASEWGRLVEKYAAVDATNDVTVQVSQGKARKITLSGNNKNVTVATTGAVAGDMIFFSRPAIGASSGCNIVNGGTGAGTLMAMTANKKAGAVVMFDGTDWSLVSSYQEA